MGWEAGKIVDGRWRELRAEETRARERSKIGELDDRKREKKHLSPPSL